MFDSLSIFIFHTPLIYQSPIHLEYYDSKMVTNGDGRSVTRVISSDRTIKINLMVTMKDFATFGYVSSSPK